MGGVVKSSEWRAAEKQRVPDSHRQCCCRWRHCSLRATALLTSLYYSSHSLFYTGFASQVKLWEGLGALSHTINERDRRNAVLSMHNADLRAAAAVGDDLQMLQVHLHSLC